MSIHRRGIYCRASNVSELLRDGIDLCMIMPVQLLQSATATIRNL